ncbi:alkyl hydroperoxide reductase [Patiriisocius marinistellae]|uniref:Thioredoxin peroxidase n=1 Tax=Patiriisocius marinistellae TaxID=2494560 RepID=A0A5J4FXX2_9FLAO|nr:peroxiredoxin [Patiriisocius marinistellae]GEQ86198.1 alkyl hydroperoxide reductase [Patiriisocius marinistellae]
MAFVGKKFPNLSVDSTDRTGVTKKINILEKAQQENKKIILFWYPKDFTFVCPTELHAFQAAKQQFEDKNTIVIGASCDTPEVHFAWLNTPKNHGGIEGVTYPILADTNRNLANQLDILDITNERFDDETGTVLVDGDNVTYRATYLIDEEGTVFHESINHMPLGRNTSEFLRLIDAYTHVQKNGEVCPANWQEGATAMNADREGVATYMTEQLN